MRALSLRAVEVCVEEPWRLRDTCRDAALVVEHVDRFRGRPELRPLVRHWIEALGGRLLGSPAAAAHIADDKIEASRRLALAGLRVPRRCLLRDAGRPRWGPPWIVKRPFEHGSRGLALVEDPRTLERRIRQWRGCGDFLLVEEFVAGREFASAVLELEGQAVCLPIVEVHLAGRKTYAKNVKWGSAPLPVAPALLQPRDARRMASRALSAFKALGLRDYARFDIKMEPGGEPCFLEANVRPSVEDGGELRLAAELHGLDGCGLAAALLESAARRHGVQCVLERLRR